MDYVENRLLYKIMLPAFLAGLADRTARRRIAARTSTDGHGTLTRYLLRRWQGYLHDSRATWSRRESDYDASTTRYAATAGTIDTIDTIVIDYGVHLI